MFLVTQLAIKALSSERDAERFRHNFGWTGPEMDLAWACFREAGDTFHDWKNLLTEWVRSDPQRAAKFGFDLITWEALGMLLIWLM